MNELLTRYSELQDATQVFIELATAACIKNIRELDSVGDYLPYKAVRLLLLKIDNAKQLRTIELNSPQIQGETGEVWLKLIKHEFPMEVKQKAYKPPNPTKWYRVYEKYRSDHQQALLESEAKLKNALMGLKEDKEKNTSKIVDDRRLLPRGGRVGPKKAWGFGARDPNGSTLAFNRGSRTKTHNGASVMRKVRRETKEIASIHGALSRPTQASNAITKLRKAPAAMVGDYQRAAKPTIRPPLPPPPKSAVSDVVETHEARAQYISDSDSEDGDDLFDDELPANRRKASSHVSLSPMKKPAAGHSDSTSKVRRTGLLSNSYKGPKPQTTTSSRPRVVPSAGKSLSPAPQQKHISLSPEPTEQSSPTRLTNTRPNPGIGPRKRKATDVFMKPRKRA